jgi:hypothetical protein
MDVSGAAPAYSIRDIVSPWGILRDTIPIPGDILLKMAESIVELMSAYAPSIIAGPPSTLTFEVDEGWGFTPAQSVAVSNGGTYGSILNVSLTTSAGFIVVTPPTLGGIALNTSSTFTVMVDSTELLAASSPIAGTIIVQDPRAPNSPQVIPLTIIVRPKATIELSTTLLEFHVTRPLIGSFPPIPTQGFQLRNTGLAASLLDYQIQKLTNLSPWLAAFSPPVGQIAGTLQQLVTVLVQPPDNTGTGTFEETLRISGYSTNMQEDITVRLVVT